MICISEAVGLKGGSKHLNYHDLWPRHRPPATLMEWRASLPGYYCLARTISKETFEIDPVYEFCCNSILPNILNAQYFSFSAIFLKFIFSKACRRQPELLVNTLYEKRFREIPMDFPTKSRMSFSPHTSRRTF